MFNKLGSDVCLFIINYFGCINTECIIDKVRGEFNAQCIVLDNVQAFFNMDDLSSADYIFTSFRKWLSVPDGAWVKTSYNNMKIEKNVNKFAQFKFAGALVKYYNRFFEISDEVYLNLFDRGENILQENFSGQCSAITKVIFNNINFDDIIKKRWENALYVYTALNQLGVKILYGDKRPSVPFFVPILVNNKHAVKLELMKYNIFLPSHWPKSEAVNMNNNCLYTSELSLVIDQRYSLEDMKRLVEVLDDICKKYR